jgi:hypothetical protein
VANDSGGTWQAECLIAEDWPQGYKDHILQELEYEVSRKLWHSLQQVRNPCVVEMLNKEQPEYGSDYMGLTNRPARIFSLGYRLTAVERRHMVISDLAVTPTYAPTKSELKPQPKPRARLSEFWHKWTKDVWLI